MNLATAGQLIRILGLLCELLGIGGVWLVSSKGVDAIPAILGPNPDVVFKGLVVFGFALWLIGRTLIATTRTRESRRRRDDDIGASELRL